MLGQITSQSAIDCFDPCSLSALNPCSVLFEYARFRRSQLVFLEAKQ